MGQSASAKLIYGVYLADTMNEEIPEWASRNVPGDDFKWDSREALKSYGLEVYSHGYEFSDLTLGIQLQWACDFGYETLDLEEIQVKIEEARPRIEQLLKDWGAPEDVKPQLLMCASFS